MLCDETKYICYINLASAGKCTYGSSCKYEHTSMLYVWKIANFTKKDGIDGDMTWIIYKSKTGELLFGGGPNGVYVFNGKSFDRKY